MKGIIVTFEGIEEVLEVHGEAPKFSLSKRNMGLNSAHAISALLHQNQTPGLSCDMHSHIPKFKRNPFK